MKRNVVMSGFGLVTALGHTVDEFWAACLQGQTKVVPVPTHWADYYSSKSRIWSPLELPDYRAYGIKRADELRYDRVVLNAVTAADDALENAGLVKSVKDERARSFHIEGVDPDRTGVFIGTGLGCITSAFNNYVPHLLGAKREALFENEHADQSELATLTENLAEQPRVNPFASCQSMANAIGAYLSIRYGTRGATDTLVYACAAGTAAIARAYRAIQYGEIDFAIAGGSEYYGDRAAGVFMAFDRLQTLALNCDVPEAANRPFDRDRSGFLFSQGGSGIVILESAEHAAKRGAHVMAEIQGVSITSDAHSLAAISAEDNAISLMLEKLLDDAELPADAIDYVNAHGTSTTQNDPIEADIIGGLFGNKPIVNSTKSILGHTIAASGTIECIVAALSMRDGVVHPSRNLENPIADLNFATSATKCDIQYAISQSFGFGGHNVGVLLKNPTA